MQSELDEDDGGDDDRVVCESKCTEVTKNKRRREKKGSRCALSVLRLVAATSCT